MQSQDYPQESLLSWEVGGDFLPWCLTQSYNSGVLNGAAAGSRVTSARVLSGLGLTSTSIASLARK